MSGKHRSGRGNGGGNGVDRRVLAVVARVMNTEAEALAPELRFVEDLRADSLRVMELVLELQEEFGIEIPDSALDRIRSVGDAVEFVRGKLAGG